MTFWIAIGGLSLIAIIPILWPLLRPGASNVTRLDHDIEVYRDQLREVKAELAANAMSERDAEEAEREIERRILRAAEADKGVRQPTPPSALTAVFLALLLPAFTLLVYSQIGRPMQPDQPLAQRDTAPTSAPTMTADQSDQVREMVEGLAQRLREQPDDAEGWTLLGRSRAVLGQFEEAAAALRRAVALSEDNADLLVSLGDILTKAAGGTITSEALDAFAKARQIAPDNLAARYFLAMADLQSGQPRKAYDAWLALYSDLPPNDENRQVLAEQIRRVARHLGIDPEQGLKSDAPPLAAGSPTPSTPPAMPDGPGPDRAAMAEAAKLSPSERREFIESMVGRLAERLREEPDDFDGWMRLGRSYVVLQKRQMASEAYRRAAELRPDDPVPLNTLATMLIEAVPADQPIPESTLSVLRRLETVQPNNPRALWFLGLADAGAGRREEAIRRWRRLYNQLPAQSKQRADLKAAIDRIEAAK